MINHDNKASSGWSCTCLQKEKPRKEKRQGIEEGPSPKSVPWGHAIKKATEVADEETDKLQTIVDVTSKEVALLGCAG